MKCRLPLNALNSADWLEKWLKSVCASRLGGTNSRKTSVDLPLQFRADFWIGLEDFKEKPDIREYLLGAQNGLVGNPAVQCNFRSALARFIAARPSSSSERMNLTWGFFFWEIRPRHREAQLSWHQNYYRTTIIIATTSVCKGMAW